MTLSRHPQLSEELLSAYIDNEVTDEERALIESTIATDPAVAWQVESLRQTIHLLQALPPLALPRSFAIDAIVADAQNTEPLVTPQPMAVARPRPTYVKKEYQWWQSLMQIWQGGNLYLRNAAAVAFALLIVLFVSDQLVMPYRLPAPPPNSATAQVAMSSPAVATSDPTATAMSNNTVVATTESTNKIVAPVSTDTATGNGVQAYAQAAPTEKITLPPPMPTAMPVAKRPPQEDADDLSGGSSAGSFAAGPSVQGAGGSLEMSTAADGSRAVPIQSNQASSPLPSAMASEQPIATPPSAADNNTNDTASQSETAALATTTTAPVAVSAAEVSMTELATVTETITETGTITPAIEPPLAATDNDTNDTDDTMAETANVTDETDHLLSWAQIITVLFTVVLGSLWWRSRE